MIMVTNQITLSRDYSQNRRKVLPSELTNRATNIIEQFNRVGSSD